MELGMIRKVDIDHEMQQSYLDYAMSVIVSRALPDARDGLKPVQRRILYAMYDLLLRPDTPYKKSARIVGEVLGKYHPHGDSAVYEAMARMAQDYSMRYMLVDGQGNFGSVDGDSPAAMRYTEARLASPAMEMLQQLDKNTVEFTANFDETLKEPLVLPAAIPNLLVNGATGIAVGMATNIPPHNLTEVVDALIFMLEHWEHQDEITVDTLMQFIKGPDFPTGGVILENPEGEGLSAAYGTGRGKVLVRARAHLEDMGRGRSRIIITELPYMTNKSSLIERIAELVREGTIDGISDLRDESDRQGMRIVIELKQNIEPEKVLLDLYKHTPMQTTFGINMLALVGGEPRLLTLKQALRVYVEHRLEVVRRRSEYDLAKARARAHILEGLRVALKNLDEIISLIRNAADVDDARQKLIRRYKLSDLQAQAILDMQLRRLAALERKKIEMEYKEVMTLIKDLETLLASPKRMRQVVEEELRAIKQTYGDRRRTQIVNLKEGVSVKTLLTTTDVTPALNTWVSITADGKVSATPDERMPRMDGRDAPRWVVRTNTHHTLYLAGADGRTAAIPVHVVPQCEKPADGVPFNKISALKEDDQLAAAFAVPSLKPEEMENLFVLTVSRGGMVKKSALFDLPGPSSQTFTLVKINDGDGLLNVHISGGSDDVLLATAQGMAIRFSEEDVRAMGLVAAGVSGIKLAVGDEVIGSGLMLKNRQVLVVSTEGKGKRIQQDEFPKQGRYGQGVVLWKLPKGIRLAGVIVDRLENEVSVQFEKAAAKSSDLKDAPSRSRATQGQTVADVKPGDAVIRLVKVWDALARWEPEPTGKRSRAAARPKPEPAPGEAMQLELLSPEPVKKSAAASPTKAKTVKTEQPAVAPKKSAGKAESAPAESTATSKSKAAPIAKQTVNKETTRGTSQKPAVKTTAASGKTVAKGKTSAAKTSPGQKDATVKTSTSSAKPTAPEKAQAVKKPAAISTPADSAKGATRKKTEAPGKSEAPEKTTTTKKPAAGGETKTPSSSKPPAKKSTGEKESHSEKLPAPKSTRKKSGD
jgi:DNA gyrase subunit A